MIVLDQLNKGINLVATVGTFVSTQLSSEDQRVGQTTNLDVQFTASHKIPFNGQILMTFPKWNPQATIGVLDYLQGAISCTSMNTAVLQTNLQCSFSNSVLTVSNLAIADVPGGSTVSFKIAGFRNPLSTGLVTGFSFLTQDSAGGSIDTTSGATLKISQPAPITTSSLTVDPSVNPSIAGIVGATNLMALSFLSPVPLNQGCNVIVTLPSQFNVGSINDVTISGLFGTTTTLNITTVGQSFSFQSCTQYSTNQLSGVIQIDSLILPGYQKATDPLTIQVQDLNGNFIAATQNGPTFTPTSGSGLQVSVVATPNTILSQADLIITVTPSKTMGIPGRFVLQFPPQYTLNIGTCADYNNMGSSLLNAAPTCVQSVTSLTLSNLISQTIVPGSVLTFKAGLVELPQTLGDLNFLAWVMQQDPGDSKYYDVDKFNGVISITMTYGNIKASVTPQSTTAYQSTLYTFSITPDHPMALNGYITITYPQQISIPDASFSQSQCKNFQGFPTTPTCVIDSKKRTLTVSNGFRIISTIPANQISTYVFSIPGIMNPLTLSTTDTFTMQTMTSAGSIMDVLTGGLTITMTQVPFIQSVVATPGSLVNSAITNYTFLITPSVPLNNSYSVIIVFPVEIIVPSNASQLACSSSDTQLLQFVQCSLYSNNSVQAQLNLASGLTGINPLQTFRITVNGIQNPPSTRQTSTFDFIMTDASLNVLSNLNKAQQPVTVMTNTPNTLSQASFTPNTTGAGQPAQYSIQIFTQYSVHRGGGLIVIYPSQIGLQLPITATVTSQATLSQANATVTVQTSSRMITISNAFQTDFAPDPVNGVTVVVSGFVNPMYNTEKANSFIVRTMDIDPLTGANYFIDQVTDGLILSIPCDYPCSTCLPNQPSVCTSCYQTSTLNKLQGGTCVSTCSTGKFYNSVNFTCDNCSSTCLACTNSSNQCTQCGVGNLLYLYANTCRSDCPDGYVTDSTLNLCKPCTNNCKTCQFTQTTCSSCDQTSGFPYFYQQSCLNNCPTDISVPIANYQCGNCDTSCKTCSGVSTNCTSCLSYMKYDPVVGTCTTVCKQGLQIYNQSLGVCLYCDPNCKTCAGNTTTCTTCAAGQVLTTENTCSAQCSMVNQIPLAGVCKTCELPCAQCNNTLNTCTRCQGDYLLYNQTCVQYCPTKYVPNNDTVQNQCVYQGLVCPAAFHVNDAGDGCIPNLFECPSGYIINQERTACVPGPGSIVPFPFLFLSGCLSILVLGSHIKDKFFTKVLTCLISLIGKQELLIYGLMVCYCGADQLYIPLILSGIAFIMQVTANIIFYLIYQKEVKHDPTFAKWCRMYPKTERYVGLLALFLNFKSIKLLYSGFYGLESCLAQFEDPIKNFFRPMRILTYFSFIFVYLPILAADVLILMQVGWGYQIFILAIESGVLALLIMVLTILEFRHPERLLMTGDEQYVRIKPRGFAGDVNVMGAMVDIDESTLIRSRMIDDDYEIQLRKRALAQILGQVGKNLTTAETKGVNLAKDLDKCLTKFDEEDIKLRRAFSLEEIKEEADSWVASGDDSHEESRFGEALLDDFNKQRRYSFPLSPRSSQIVPDPHFKQQIKEIKQAIEELYQDNVYADCKPPAQPVESRRKKTVSRRTQTYLRELLMMEGEALQDSDMEVILDEEAEIEQDFAQALINGVIDGLSDTESQGGGKMKKKKTKKKKKKGADAKVKPEVPDFELVDIMGEFEIDDLGNFIILRGEKGELLDKRERRVNRRGYLVDRFGNVINKDGQIIFKAIELDSDDEIPAPFGFEKRKKNLLSIGEENDFRVKETEKQVPDDEDLIDRELKAMRKSGKKKRRQLENGDIVEEAGDEGDESSVDSLMAESPAKYEAAAHAKAVLQGDVQASSSMGEAGGIKSEKNDLLDKITKATVPKKKPPPAPIKPQTVAQVKPKLSPRSKRQPQSIDNGSQNSRPKSVSNSYAAPKRIKREDTKEIFPSLAIESIEQKKLFKIAESIGGLANQIADAQKRQTAQSQEGARQSLILAQNNIDQEALERMKQEHFKDLINEGHMSMNQHLKTINSHMSGYHQGTSDHRAMQSKASLEKVYGNLGDVLAYEERIIEQKSGRPHSPESSQMTLRRGKKHDRNDDRRMTGLEAIYLQKFDKKQHAGFRRPNQEKAKFRTTLQQFVDDPELLVDDGIDHQRQNEMNSMVSNKLDRLQRQYVSSTSTRLLGNLPITAMGFINANAGGSLTVHGDNNYLTQSRKLGSAAGLTLNPDISQLDPVLKGNWMQNTSQPESSLQ